MSVTTHFNHNDYQDVGAVEAVASQGSSDDKNKLHDNKSDMQSAIFESPTVYNPSTHRVSHFICLVRNT